MIPKANSVKRCPSLNSLTSNLLLRQFRNLTHLPTHECLGVKQTHSFIHSSVSVPPQQTCSYTANFPQEICSEKNILLPNIGLYILDQHYHVAKCSSNCLQNIHGHILFSNHAHSENWRINSWLNSKSQQLFERGWVYFSNI